jgi:hypothetical protein
MTDIKKIDGEYIANTYARFPVTIVSGKGSVAADDAGKEYIDMGCGIGVTAFGYCDDEWMKAVTAQLGKVQHTSNLYFTEPGALLAEMLCKKTGMKKVFFCNSGAEANECAIKAARKYAAEKKGPDCLHHRHHEKQLPRPHADHPGRHRAGALPRAVPAADAGLRLCRRRGHSERQDEAVRGKQGAAICSSASRARAAWCRWTRISCRTWPPCAPTRTSSSPWTRCRRATAAPARCIPT